ncbi:MAG: T9SS type A sorting domain-containing protein [Flavobacteriales bacterium]|nr:T9SS type A sorting domain-containing protein [Flavobacteriales bacterium]
MKHLFPLAFIFCSFTASAQWELMTPIKNTSEYEDIVMVNELVGYAADRPTGTILATEDGGNKWVRRQHLLSNNPLAIHMWDEQRGVCVGQTGSVLRTTDGFRTVQSSWNAGYGHLNCVFFINDTLGWVGTQSGRIYRSTDAGATWTLMQSGQSASNYITAIQFVDENIGYASCYGGGKVLKSTDGGLTWTSIAPEPLVFIRDLHFFDALTGVAVGSAGHVIRTTDGGDTWTMMGGTPQSTISIFFTGRDTGYAVGTGGQVVRSLDGGITWANFLPAIFNASIHDAAYVDGRIIIAGGTGDIFRSPRIGCSSTPWVPLVSVNDELLCADVPGITQWYRNMVPIEGGTESCLQADQPGDYHVVITDELGCTSAPSIVITLECPIPPAADVQQQGDELCTATVGNAQWYWNSEPIADATTPCITPEAPGLYHVVVTDPNGCESAPSPAIEVECAVIPAPEVIVEEDGQLCTPEMWFIHWYHNDQLIIDGGGMPCIVPEVPGTYHVVVETEHGCVSDPSLPVEVIGTGVEAILNSTALSIAPNPATDHILIVATDGMPIRSIEVFASNGALMHRSNTPDTRVSIEVGSWPQGLYAVQVRTAEGMVSQRFIKDR